MERSDELNTKVRTTGYDNDRLRSMHQSAVEVAGNAEREMNVWKSRASCVHPFPHIPATFVGAHSSLFFQDGRESCGKHGEKVQSTDSREPTAPDDPPKRAARRPK